jgi:hypothetical protein
MSPVLVVQDAMNLSAEVHIRAAGLPSVITTVEEALALIDRNLAPELQSLPRWTFAKALLAEALRTGKARDMKAASRQLTQALRNEKWLDEQQGAK